MESVQTWSLSVPVCIAKSTPSDCFTNLVTGFGAIHCACAVAARSVARASRAAEVRVLRFMDEEILLHYFPSCVRAACMGASDTRISPP